MAKREYLDDNRRSALDQKFGQQGWNDKSAAPKIATNTFGPGWRWTWSDASGWYLKNKKDFADVVRHNVLQPIASAVNSSKARKAATILATAAAGPQAGMAVNAGLSGLKASHATDYGIQKFREFADSDYDKRNDPVDYDFRRVMSRGFEGTGRAALNSQTGGAANVVLSRLPWLTAEPGQVRSQGSQRVTANRNSAGYNPSKRDPFAARRRYRDTPLGDGNGRDGNPQTLFKPYSDSTGEAVVVTGSHLAPDAVSVYDRQSGRLLARSDKPRSIGNGNRANWDLGAPGHAFNDVVIVFEGTGRTMYVKDGRGRWKTDKI